MSRIAFLVFAWFFSPFVAAQEYPARAITMVVPFPPGGVADIVGRPLAAMMEKSLKHPVVIVNRTGAGGALGMREVARAAPDGYTILMGLSSISIFPVSERVNGKQPAFELSDFAPIALVTADPTVLVVRADSPYKSVKDFVAAAKANPGKINYSSSGVYGTLPWRSSPTRPASSFSTCPTAAVGLRSRRFSAGRSKPRRRARRRRSARSRAERCARSPAGAPSG